MKWKILKRVKLTKKEGTGIKWSSAIEIRAPMIVSKIEPIILSKAPVNHINLSNYLWRMKTHPISRNALPEFPSVFPILSRNSLPQIWGKRRSKRSRTLMKTIKDLCVRDLHSPSFRPSILRLRRVNSNARLPNLLTSMAPKTDQISGTHPAPVKRSVINSSLASPMIRYG